MHRIQAKARDALSGSASGKIIRGPILHWHRLERAAVMEVRSPLLLRKTSVYFFSVACNEFDDHTSTRHEVPITAISDLRKVCDA